MDSVAISSLSTIRYSLSTIDIFPERWSENQPLSGMRRHTFAARRRSCHCIIHRLIVERIGYFDRVLHKNPHAAIGGTL